MLLLALAVLIIFASITLPGLLFNLPLAKDATKAICLAPATSIALLSIFAIAFSRMDIRANYFSLIIGLGSTSIILLGFSLLLQRRKSHQRMRVDKKELLYLVMFTFIMAILAAYVFLTVLDGPDCYFQAWDNQTHLRKIRAFVETGDYSSFNSQTYGNPQIAPQQIKNGFYPSAWHLLASMLVSLLNIPVTTAANAINILCVGLLLPLSLFLCLRELGIVGPKALALCAVVCIGVPIYPWDLISYGPLYPNLLGFCLLPGEMALLLNLVNTIEKKSPLEIIKNAFLLLLGMTSLALAHTNTVFSLGLILAPYIIDKVGQLIKKRQQNLPVSICLAIPLLIILTIWIIINRLPFMSNVVNCHWQSFTSVPQAFFSALFLGTTTHPVQLLVPALVFVGIYFEIKERNYCLAITYILLVLFYTIDAGTDLTIKPFLTGFWYNDYHRISAMAGLISILFACKAINRIIQKLTETYFDQKPFKHAVVTGIAAAGMVLIVFYPSIPLPQKQELPTAFGYQIKEMRYQFDKQLIYYDIFSPLEEDFCKTTLPQFNTDNSIVINNPDDGSLFAYSAYGLNMYYRSWYPPSSTTETKESNIIRHHLNEIADNSTVREAVEKIGAKYVLQLDHGDQTQEYRIQYNYDNAEEWCGIDLINESTPGFTLVAANDDIRLYRIDLN